jgi:hypothetical protein
MIASLFRAKGLLSKPNCTAAIREPDGQGVAEALHGGPDRFFEWD